MVPVTRAFFASSPFSPELGAVPANPIAHPVVTVFGLEPHHRDIACSQLALVVGFSGSGKTTWLDTVERQARSLQWAVVAEDAQGDVFDRCTQEHIPALLKALGGASRGRRVTGFSAPRFPAVLDSDSSSLPPVSTEDSWVHQLNDTAALLKQYGSGLLITIDGATSASLDQLNALFTGVSRVQQSYENIAFIITVERSEYSALIKKQKGEFLHEFDLHFMPLLSLNTVASFLDTEVNAHGKQWEPEALDIAISKTYGYPFLVQLVGHYCWLESGADTLISTAVAEAGVARAMREFMRLIVEPIINSLSDLDIVFLQIMAELGTPTKIADIVHKMERSADTVAQYRRRLVDRGYITVAKRGWVEFAIPGLQTYFKKTTP